MKYLIIASSLLLTVHFANAQKDEHGHDDHGHDEHKKAPKAAATAKAEEHSEEAGHDHKEEEEHGHKEAKTDEHGHDDEHGEEEASASVGPGKAVLEVKDEGQKLKLSPEAQSKINLKFDKIIVQGGSTRIPKAALLEYQANTAVYRLNQDGFIELVPVKVSKREADSVLVSGALASNEQIAISGVPLLRAAQLEASGQGGEGHAH